MPASSNYSTAAPWLLRDGKGNRAVGLEPLSKALPAGSRVCEFEVFDHFAFAIDDHDGVFLTGPIQGAKGPVG